MISTSVVPGGDSEVIGGNACFEFQIMTFVYNFCFVLYIMKSTVSDAINQSRQLYRKLKETLNAYMKSRVRVDLRLIWLFGENLYASLPACFYLRIFQV